MISNNEQRAQAIKAAAQNGTLTITRYSYKMVSRVYAIKSGMQQLAIANNASALMRELGADLYADFFGTHDLAKDQAWIDTVLQMRNSGLQISCPEPADFAA